MPRNARDVSSSPDPLELLPPPRFSPFKRSPHKQLQLRLLELNADINNDKTIENVLQELTPGRGNLAFLNGNVDGRDLFVTTRKAPARKRAQRKKSESGETPKRGRPRKKQEAQTPQQTHAEEVTDNLNTTQTEQSAVEDTVQEDILPEDVEVIEMADGTTDPEPDRTHTPFSEIDENGFDESTYHIETPSRAESPLPVTPYRSYRSSPPSSPVYEEYQVPIPPSSSPAKPSSTSATPQFESLPIPRRRRSQSRERRMSFAPLDSSNGLPATPRRQTHSTTPNPLSSLRDTASPAEGMTTIRNWAAELASDAFRSPEKLVTALPPLSPITLSDTDEPPTIGPQIARLRTETIVITSSPPEVCLPIRYQWKTRDEEAPLSPESIDDGESSLRRGTPGRPTSERNTSRGSPASPVSPIARSSPTARGIRFDSPREKGSRRSSPERSFLKQFGSDVVDIASVSPLAAKRAAGILLRTPYYARVTEHAASNEFSDQWEDEGADAEEEEEEEEDNDDDAEQWSERAVLEDDSVQPTTPTPPPRLSLGPWSKLDWKRLEKCLDSTNSDTSDAITLFLERYLGRERPDVELRFKALMLTRRRKVLEGKNVEFKLGTGR
jgi:hypothetical protein